MSLIPALSTLVSGTQTIPMTTWALGISILLLCSGSFPCLVTLSRPYTDQYSLKGLWGALYRSPDLSPHTDLSPVCHSVPHILAALTYFYLKFCHLTWVRLLGSLWLPSPCTVSKEISRISRSRVTCFSPLWSLSCAAWGPLFPEIQVSPSYPFESNHSESL